MQGLGVCCTRNSSLNKTLPPVYLVKKKNRFSCKTRLQRNKKIALQTTVCGALSLTVYYKLMPYTQTEVGLKRSRQCGIIFRAGR